MTKYLVSVATFFVLHQAHAWLFFDPYIGYNKGQHQSTRTQGIGYGARLGVQMGSLYIAGDYSMSDMQQGTLSSVKYNDLAAVIGGDFRNFRVWYGQILSTNFSYSSAGSTIAYKGTGSKFGVGALVSPKAFLNLEMKTYDYTESSNAGVTTPIAEIGTMGFLSISYAFQ
jgi:hypothetical protein